MSRYATLPRPMVSIVVACMAFLIVACGSNTGAGKIAGDANRFDNTPSSFDTVLVKKKTDDHFWTPRETPVLADYPALAAIPKDSLSQYGGWTGKRFDQTGFFYATQESDGTWWLVDPEGYAFFSVGLNSVEAGVESTSDEKKLKDRFFGAYSSVEDWANQAQIWLGDNGFNTLGSWSDWRGMNDGERAQTPYTEQLHLLAHFVWRDKKERLGDEFKSQWMLYYIFDDEFPQYCARKMAQVAPRTKDAPYLLGYFTDNELGQRVNQLDRFLKLDGDDPVRMKVMDWLKTERGVSPNADGSVTVSQTDRTEFFSYMTGRYYKIVHDAVRAADPNHMIIGDRLNYDQQDNPLIWQSAAPYVDVFSYNWYHVWNPNENSDVANWARWSGKPVMITEWYAKGLDTGMENDTGAGWIVATQDERGKFYETFSLGLLDDPSVVGFHWFRYRDNNVDAAHLVDWSNRDSNKGFYDVDYQAYAPLETRARTINSRVYGLRAAMLGEKK
ncbi:MAG: hypothetical protein V3U82_01435 [Robiginitomaculum sp.]